MKHHNVLGIVDQGIVGLTGFITVVLLGRAVTPDELGVYSLALSVVLFAKMIQESALTGPYTVFSHRLHGTTLDTYSGNSLIQSLMLSATGVVLLMLYTLTLHIGPDPSGLAGVFTVLCMVFPVIVLREYIRKVTFAHLQLGHAFIMDTVIAGCQVAGLYLLLRIASLSAAAAFLVTGIACAIGMAVWLRRSELHFSFSRDGFTSDLKKNWKFGKWALGGQTIGTIMFYAMPWMLAFYHGTGSAGLLAACNSIVGLINIVLLGLDNVLAPKAAKSYARGGHRQLWHTLVTFLLVFLFSMGSITILLFFIGDLAAGLLFDGRYPGAAPVINILALNLLASSLVIVAGNGLWALNRPSANFLAELARLAVTFGLVLWLVPGLETIGAAYALLGGTIAGGIVSFIVLWRLILAHNV